MRGKRKSILEKTKVGRKKKSGRKAKLTTARAKRKANLGH